MTYRDFYTAVVTANINDELTAFATAAIKKLDDKNDKKRTTTSPNQKANEDIKEQILDELAANPNRIYTCKELAEQFTDNVTQKASALLKQLVDTGKVTKYDKIKDSKKNTVKGYQFAQTN